MIDRGISVNLTLFGVRFHVMGCGIIPIIRNLKSNFPLWWHNDCVLVVGPGALAGVCRFRVNPR
jgi:hypothetical protein